MRCNLPPKGWRCNAEAGHDGPCAAWPDSLWLRAKWAYILRDPSLLWRNRG
jgi:hypothetical protein